MNEKEVHFFELNLLKEIAEGLNRGIQLPTVLDDPLNLLLKMLHLESGWIFLLNEQRELQLATSANLPPGLRNEKYKPMCGQDCYCINRFHDGRLKQAVNVLQCKRIQEAAARNYGDTYGLLYHASVALRSGDEYVGILNVALSGKALFKEEELALLESVALQIGSAIKRIQLTEESRQNAISEERSRLAQELHDSVKQLLFSAQLLAGTGVAVSHNEEIKQLFKDIASIAQTAQSEMRELIWQLRPLVLENGLICAIKDYAVMLGLSVEEDLQAEMSLNAEAEEAVWRIAQEAINNCKKYAGVSTIQLTTRMSGSRLIFKIKDRGAGFDFNPDVELPSYGLKSILNRAKRINGEAEIHSEIGKGTEITVSLPF